MSDLDIIDQLLAGADPKDLGLSVPKEKEKKARKAKSAEKAALKAEQRKPVVGPLVSVMEVHRKTICKCGAIHTTVTGIFELYAEPEFRKKGTSWKPKEVTVAESPEAAKIRAEGKVDIQLYEEKVWGCSSCVEKG